MTVSFYRWLQEHYGDDSEYAKRVAEQHAPSCPCRDCQDFKRDARKQLRKGKRK